MLRRPPKKIILTNFQSPGDILMLTAAVRDLHACHPERFLTDVRTSVPELWDHNPHLAALSENDPDVETIPCHYPLIEHGNERPVHFIQGFMEFLAEWLGIRLMPMQFSGDIHLSEFERNQSSPVSEKLGYAGQYWIIVAGGKSDYTIKWWSPQRFQNVVDAFRGKIQFVQVGQKEDHHPPLLNVLDLRGKTTIRELILLMHHSSGVLCPVTFAMHLAAAVAVPEGAPGRPCVVVAGGREPPHWEAYPHHQFIHTVGSLPCCRTGGCWRSRTVPIGDNDVKDHPKHLCVDVVGNLPHCMSLITPRAVIERIEYYLS